MTTTELERAILDAHKRSDTQALQRLQAEYRRTAVAVRPAGTARAIDVPRGISRGSSSSVELRDTPARHKVHLPDSVRSTIEREILDVRYELGDVEAGGLLLAHQRPRLHPRDAYIVAATGAGSDGEHGRSIVRYRPERIKAELPEVLARQGLVEIGSWHSHPTTDATPSDGDLECWRSDLEENDLNLACICFIATPGERGWTVPNLTAWVTWRTWDGRYLCDPARLI